MLFIPLIKSHKVHILPPERPQGTIAVPPEDVPVTEDPESDDPVVVVVVVVVVVAVEVSQF